MSRKARSIKGEVVDFDLLEVKRKIGDKPVSTDVKNRENFVFSKRRRGAKKVINKMLDAQDANETNQKSEVNVSASEVKEVEATDTPIVTSTKVTKEEKEGKPKRRRIVKKKK
jgi:hypothetical protein